MSIKLVVNGYFRSGTTLVWELLKEHTNNYIVFYEPLHPSLPRSVTRENILQKKHSIGNIFVWKEYQNLNDNELKKLFLNHPNLEKSGIENEIVFKNYFDILNHLNFDVALQPNRAHMFLDVFIQEYNAKVIHIIRHPLDVLMSIEKRFYMSKNKLKEFIKKYFLKSIYLHHTFEFDKDYNWLLKHVGDLYHVQDHGMLASLGFKKNISYFEKFVIVWILYNYYAMIDIKKNGGLLQPYELFYLNKEESVNRLSNYLDIELTDFELTKSNYFKYEDKDLQKFIKIAKKHNLEKQLKYISDELLTAFNIDYNLR